MFRKFTFSKPMLVLSFLILAALACYSDSPLWPNELTQPPPSPTFLPTPDPANPVRFAPGDIVMAPIPRLNENPRPFLFTTDYPEPLRPDSSNSSSNCEFETEIEILYVGYKVENGETKTYDLVNCSSAVGWTPEENLVGPLKFLRGQSALTTQEGAQGQAFPLHPQPPPVPQMPATLRCLVNEVVDILNVSAPFADDPNDIWYQIRCGDGTVGWAAQNRLFGPLVLNLGDTGMVLPEFESISLTAEAGPIDQGEVVAECTGGSIVNALAIDLIEDTVYYQVACGDVTGWTEQDPLVKVNFPPGSSVLILVPEPEEDTDTTAVPDEELDDEVAVDETFQQEEVVLTAPLTANAGPSDDSNETVGECVTNSVVTISQVAIVNSNFYYNVECGDSTGWLDGFYVLTNADFHLNELVAITEDGFVGAPPDVGFYISDEPKTVAGVRGASGECMADTLATTNDVTYLVQVNTLRVYYAITCTDIVGEELSGWTLQTRLQPASAVEESATSTSIFGG